MKTHEDESVLIDRDQISARALGGFFSPRTVALIGASDRSYLATTIWKSITENGFQGGLFPVNPSRSEVFGVSCYPTIESLPFRPDLCLVGVSEQAALDVLKQCSASGVQSAMLFTAFSGNQAGNARRTELRTFLNETTMLVAGSGTFGLTNLESGFMPFLGPPPNTMSGNVALVCQSGGILNGLSRCLRTMGVGLTKTIATGGEDQLCAAHFIDYLLSDAKTQAIGCVVEQIKDVSLFRNVCSRARDQNVPIVVLDIGRSEKGKEAALAHSGSLASDQAVVEGLFSQVNVIRVNNLTEMVNVLAALSRQAGSPIGQRAAMISISGGETGLLADLADKHGMVLADLTPETDANLRNILASPEITYHNPIDVAAGSLLVMTKPSAYVDVVQAALNDANVDYVIARHLEQAGVFEGLMESARVHAKPLFLYTRTSHELLPIPEDKLSASLLIVPDAEQAVSAIAKIASYHQAQNERGKGISRASASDEPLQNWLLDAKPGILMEDVVFPLLNEIGVTTPPYRLLQRSSDVGAELIGLDGPYIAKVLSNTIVHRRSAGGVRANLQSKNDVRLACQELFSQFGSELTAVVVEPMLQFDVEFILGAKRLDSNGLVILLGLGGTFVEDLKRMSLRLSPLEESDVTSMIKDSGVAAAVDRINGKRSASVHAELKSVLLAFEKLCRRCGPALAEFDINPLVYLAGSNRFSALDGKIILRPH